MDIIEVNKMKLVNEKAIESDNSFVQENYKFNFFIQIVLTAVSGVTLKQDKSNPQGMPNGAILGKDCAIIQRSTCPIANVYYKFSHYD